MYLSFFLSFLYIHIPTLNGASCLCLSESLIREGFALLTLLPRFLMRLALLRLLDRPSTLQLLEALVSSPVGVQQLSSALGGRCLHCHTRGRRSDPPAIDSPKSIGGSRGFRIRRCKVKSNEAEKESVQLPLATNRNQAGRGDTLTSADRDLHSRRYPAEPSDNANHFPDTNSPTGPGEEFDSYENWTLDAPSLELESDIAGAETIGNRLVDKPGYQRDFALWEELLRYRQRHYGDDGAIDIWKGLKARNRDSELPVEGYYADIFWQSFVDVGLRREEFLQEIHEHARNLWESSEKKWGSFYESVVGGFFNKGLHAKAVKWHWLLKDIHLSRPNEILHVFRQASSTKAGLTAFRHICKKTPGHQIYSSVVPTLYKQNRLQDTIKMHKFLVRRKDAPARREDVQPLVDYVRQYRSKQENEEFHTQLLAAGILKENIQSPAKEPVSETSTGLSPNEAEEADQNHFQDGFGARLFATKALTFELILSGLRMFSVDAIGPLSLREMAIRAENAKEVSNNIDELEQSGISIGNSVFSRVVKKLARENNDRLLRDVLKNDQHPDVLEDWRIQESLLASYYLTGDWRQFDRTVTILKTLSEEDSGSFNLLFRNALNVGNRAGATKLIEQMREHNVPLTHKSRQWMFWKLIKHRRKGGYPGKDAESFGELSYLLGIWQYVVQTGGHIPPAAWREGLKRLGMTNRWDELQKLCLWLAHWYSPASRVERTLGAQPSVRGALSKPARDDVHALHPADQHSPLQTIFTPMFLQALVAWGFKMRVSSEFKGNLYNNPYSDDRQPLIPWMRGIILLRQLKDRGIPVPRQMIAKACRQRLAVLYGEYRESSRPINRVLREENPWTLDEVLADINSAWGQPLFMGEELDRHSLVNPPQKVAGIKRYQEEQRQVAERRSFRSYGQY